MPLLRKDETALDRLRIEADKGSRVSITSMSLCELYAGAYASRDPPMELNKIERLISRLVVLELTKEASRKYGELINHSTIRTQPVGDFDLIIAAIALSAGESLSTRDPDFERIPGLIVERW